MRFATVLFISPALLPGQPGGGRTIQAYARRWRRIREMYRRSGSGRYRRTAVSGGAGRIRNLAGRGAGRVPFVTHVPIARSLANSLSRLHRSASCSRLSCSARRRASAKSPISPYTAVRLFRRFFRFW